MKRLLFSAIICTEILFSETGLAADRLAARMTMEKDTSILVHEFNRMDNLTGDPVRMIIGNAAFGKPGDPMSPFAREGYGCDNYDDLTKIIKADGFNSYAFGVAEPLC